MRVPGGENSHRQQGDPLRFVGKCVGKRVIGRGAGDEQLDRKLTIVGEQCIKHRASVERAAITNQMSREDTYARAMPRDETYVIDLCDAILGERALRQHRFAWLLGDVGKNGHARTLPVDAYYPAHRVVVEYRERQHDEPVAFFDRRDTVSGVGRREQRRLYDLRREQEIPAHGLGLVIVKPSDLAADRRLRLRRDIDHDHAVLVERLAVFLHGREDGP